MLCRSVPGKNPPEIGRIPDGSPQELNLPRISPIPGRSSFRNEHKKRPLLAGVFRFRNQCESRRALCIRMTTDWLRIHAQKRYRFSVSENICTLVSLVNEAVMRLTESLFGRVYSHSQLDVKRCEHGSMSNKFSQNDSPVGALKNESARQRWELFHRAIEHAKQSNSSAMQESESTTEDGKSSGPLLTIVR